MTKKDAEVVENILFSFFDYFQCLTIEKKTISEDEKSEMKNSNYL